MTDFEESSGNVFADLGLPEPEKELEDEKIIQMKSPTKADPIRPNYAGRWPRLVRKDGDTFNGEIALGNLTQWRFQITNEAGKILVGFYRFPTKTWDGLATPEQLLKRYKGILLGDAQNIADLINDQFGYDENPVGMYYSDCCSGP